LTRQGVWRHGFQQELARSLAGFAGVALFLAALGIYGVLAYFVSQRSRELGIRLALGAKPQEQFRMLVRQGMRPVAVGAAPGSPARPRSRPRSSRCCSAFAPPTRRPTRSRCSRSWRPR